MHIPSHRRIAEDARVRYDGRTGICAFTRPCACSCFLCSPSLSCRGSQLSAHWFSLTWVHLRYRQLADVLCEQGPVPFALLCTAHVHGYGGCKHHTEPGSGGREQDIPRCCVAAGILGADCTELRQRAFEVVLRPCRFCDVRHRCIELAHLRAQVAELTRKKPAEVV